MSRERHYKVYKTYHCNILKCPCLKKEENTPYNTHPPDCSTCEIAHKTKPPDTDERYATVTIIPGKGVFGKKRVDEP